MTTPDQIQQWNTNARSYKREWQKKHRLDPEYRKRENLRRRRLRKLRLDPEYRKRELLLKKLKEKINEGNAKWKALKD